MHALTLLLALTITSPQLLDADDARAGWLQLFDGHSLFGWHQAGEVNWRVEEGVIVADEGGVGLLHTWVEFAAFELRLEFRAAADTNSGVFIRTPPHPARPDEDCYEINIAADSNPFPTGSIVGRRKRTVVPAPSETADGFRSMSIRCDRERIVVRVDGTVTCELELTDAPPVLQRGYIGLQHNQGRIEFRNVRLLPLDMQALFNGQDLEGWRTDRLEQSRVEVVDSELHLIGGKGQIETRESFGDFALRLSCYVDGDGLNSGVFFRSIPGDMWMGYESQINNAVFDGDPTRPKDCGTGGIFRRQNARRVVARDFEWFTKTIVATGPHIAVWVNGYPVSAWTDTRGPHENPRQGLREEAGTILFQGHDPGTKLRFREIAIAPFPDRGPAR